MSKSNKQQDMKTIDIIKQKRTVPDQVHAKRKEWTAMKKAILNSLKSGEKTIPQIAEETKLDIDQVTYHLMSLRKFGDVKTGEIDDMDEYFFYSLNK